MARCFWVFKPSSPTRKPRIPHLLVVHGHPSHDVLHPLRPLPADPCQCPRRQVHVRRPLLPGRTWRHAPCAARCLWMSWP